MAVTALLDACVLYPVVLRDTLLRFAEAEFYRPLWTERILEEVQRNILERRPDLRPEHLGRTFDAMRRAFPEAFVEDYEHLIPAMTNHEKDRHVLAAAVAGRTDVIVTHDVEGFPPDSCAPYNVGVQTPDEFLLHTFSLDPDLGIEVLAEQAADKKSPPMAFAEIVDTLERQAPNFAAECRRPRDK